MTPTPPHIDDADLKSALAGTLVTPRLSLRPLAARDEEVCVTYFMSERAKYTGGNVNRFQAWKNFAAHLGHWHSRGYGLWAVTETPSDAIIGMVGPFFPATWPEGELGWVLFDGAEGKGFAAEATKATRAHAYDVLGWSSIVSYINEENLRSIKLAERLGCTLDPEAERPAHASSAMLIYRHPPREACR